MGPIRAAPKVTLPKPLADTGGYVDPFADDSSTTHAVSSLQQPDDPGFSADPLGDNRSGILHPLFRNERSVISRTDSDELWMQGNAVRLLGLCGVRQIAALELHSQFVVAAKLDRDLRGIRGFELRSFGSTKGKDECLLLVRRERGFLAFDEVDAAGLPADVAAWFVSLKDRLVRKSLYRQEMRSQVGHNEDAFRTFYDHGLEGLAPDFYSVLHAWVALDWGRILCVSGSLRPSQKNNGMRTSFSVEIDAGAAHLTCMTRSSLYGMPALYHPYFLQPFIKVRDVVPNAEEELEVELEIEVIPGEGSEVLDDVDEATGGLIA